MMGFIGYQIYFECKLTLKVLWTSKELGKALVLEDFVL